MKLLCVSDRIDPLVYADSLAERFCDADVILGAGDLPVINAYGYCSIDSSSTMEQLQ